MTALRSIANARGMLDDIASTQPLTNDQAIEIAHAYARLSHAEAALTAAEADKVQAKSIDAIATVLEQIHPSLSKALESISRGVDTGERFLRASWPRQRPASGGSVGTPAPVVR